MASKRILVTYNNSETLLRCFSPNDDCCPFKNKSSEDGDHGILFFKSNSILPIEIPSGSSKAEKLSTFCGSSTSIFSFEMTFRSSRTQGSSNYFLHQISYFHLEKFWTRRQIATNILGTNQNITVCISTLYFRPVFWQALQVLPPWTQISILAFHLPHICLSSACEHSGRSLSESESRSFSDYP